MSDWKRYLQERIDASGDDLASEAESIEEMAQHLADYEADALASGASVAEARQAALAQVPDLHPVRDEIRLRGSARVPVPPPQRASRLAGSAHDIRYAVRLLVRNPGFALVCVLTLALGIAANSAVFSLVHAVLLKPLPYPQPDRLVALFHLSHGQRAVMSPPNFLDLRAQSRVLDRAAAYSLEGITLTGAGQPARLRGALVTDQFFDVLGIAPALGRSLRADENRPGHTAVVVLGHHLWQERFAGDRRVIGRAITLDGVPHTVVGVMPATFAWPAGADLWVPFEFDNIFTSVNRGGWYVQAIGRLKPGATTEAASADADTIARRLAREYPGTNAEVGFAVVPLHTAIVGPTEQPLLVLLGAVAFVLFIACANVANLLLARASGRGHELALRAALGAGRARIARQLLIESAVIALCGGAAGLLLGQILVRAFVAFAPEGIPRLSGVSLDTSVVAFTFGITALTTLLVGAVPAVRLATANLATTLKQGSRPASAAARTTRLRSVLVVAETALASVLLVGALLLLASFTKLQRVDPGFDRRDALTFRVSLPESVYRDAAARSAFFDRLLPRLRVIPGVRDVAGVLLLPLSGDNYVFSFAIEGRPPSRPGEDRSLVTQVVTDSYFRTLGVRLVRGRLFTDADTVDTTRVMVISEAAVRRYFPNEDPIGKRITLGWRLGPNERAGGEVVGIVGDVHEGSLRERQPAEAYVPYAQTRIEGLDIVVKTTVPPLSIARSVESAVHEIDSDLPVAKVATLERHVGASLDEPRFYSLLLGGFAALALVLAATGVFGVLSCLVADRTREIGIRLALGCEPGHVMRQVVGRAMMLALVGLVAGVLLALPLCRALSGFLFETSATDPSILASVSGLLAVVALAASYVPAWRATRVDPLIALHGD